MLSADLVAYCGGEEQGQGTAKHERTFIGEVRFDWHTDCFSLPGVVDTPHQATMREMRHALNKLLDDFDRATSLRPGGSVTNAWVPSLEWPHDKARLTKESSIELSVQACSPSLFSGACQVA